MKRETQRLRTQTRVALVVFWTLFALAVVLIAMDLRSGWFVGAAALGWCGASVTRSIIDAHYFVEES